MEKTIEEILDGLIAFCVEDPIKSKGAMSRKDALSKLTQLFKDEMLEIVGGNEKVIYGKEIEDHDEFYRKNYQRNQLRLELREAISKK